MKGHWIDFTERFISKKWKYKTVKEIISQKWKNNIEKLQECVEYEKKHKWLVNIKLDGWLWLQNKDLSWKTIKDIKEIYAWELLEMIKAKEIINF